MIKGLKAREILDSRGKPTVEVELRTNKGVFRASVPSGASEGKHEAIELKASEAVKNVNQIIAPELEARDPALQKEIDELMIDLDGTENKSKLGANAILPVSIAVCRAGAAVKKLPLWKYISQIAKTKPGLPTPSVLLIEGGLHAKNKLDFQEFMIVTKFEQAKEIYQKLGKILATGLGDEGGFAPQISDPNQTLDFIMEAARGYTIKIGLDCAASHWRKKKYDIDFYTSLVSKYPIIFLEDPFGEEDWELFQEITRKLGKKVTIVGDDLLTTNVKRIKKARSKRACNGTIIKPDQVGTVNEVIEAVKLAKSFDWKIMVSHRAGETMDDFIADLAVGIGADFIKSGGPTKPERLVKYNRLLKIEEEK
ncbi:enolase [Patescibacteria group bacterium]|nr:enolase [Patescibacteria group bacterium]